MIPKKIYVSWVNKNIVNSNSLLVKKGLANLILLNPDWKVFVYDNQEPVEYLKDNLDSSIFKLFDNTHIVEKLDTWRLLKLYNEGGMYVDVDRLCNIKLSETIKPSVKCILPTSKDFDFSQDLMISEEKNPIFKIAIEMQIERRWAGNKSTYFLGPQTYMHAVTKALTNEIINTNPGKNTMDFLRKQIKDSGFLDTYTENSPYDTYLFRNEQVYFDHEVEKRKLYAEYNIKHWTNEW
jgi:mannosyltransferase OCH1-like enzyme